MRPKIPFFHRNQRFDATAGALLLGAIALLARPRDAAATTAADLCTGDPCNVSANVTVTPGSMLDFGTAELRIKAAKSMTLGGTGVRSLDIRARRVTLEAGASILGGGDDASVSILATGGPIVLQKSGTTFSKIDLSGVSVGYLTLEASGDVTLNGRLLLNGSGSDSSGGSLDIVSGGALLFGAEVRAGAAGTYAGAGSITATAATGITVDGELDASAPGGFGSIDLTTALGPIAVNKPVTSDGGDPDGTGGDIFFTTDYGNITIAAGANLSATGGSGNGTCGDGGYIKLDSGLAASLSANVNLKGGTGCSGGQLSVEVSTTFSHLAGTINVSGQGTGDLAGDGGSVDVFAEGDVTIIGLDVSGVGGGGYAELRSVRGKVETSGAILAKGPVKFPGSVEIEACTVNVKSTSTIDTRVGGLNQITGRSAVTIAGKLYAGASGQNLLSLRSGSPTLTGSTILPAPTVTVGTSVPACPPPTACGNGLVEPGEFCDDGARTGTASGCCAAGCGATSANGASCNDGTFCNGADTCSNGACSLHAGNPCAGATGQCATTTCSETNQCNAAAGTACNEGDDNPCTAGACSNGACAPVPAAGSCDDADGNPCTAGECSNGACAPTPTDGTCSDGVFCNGAESCVDGVCRSAAVACSTDSCDEGAAQCESFCGDGVAGAGETCGEPGLPGCGNGNTCRNCACEPGVLSNDSYVCYQTSNAPVPAWSFAPVTRAIVDRFENKRFDVTSVSQLCVPVVVSSATGIYTPRYRSISEVDHAIGQNTTLGAQPAFVPLNRTFADRYRSLPLTLTAQGSLMLRSKIADFGPIVACDVNADCSGGDTCQSGVCLPDPAAAPTSAPSAKTPVDNYKCYKARLQSGKLQKIRNLRITDLFGNTVTYTATAVSRVCSPAAFGALNPDAPTRLQQLTCYKIKANATTPPQAFALPREVSTLTRGLNANFLETGAVTELCVPSQVAG